MQTDNVISIYNNKTFHASLSQGGSGGGDGRGPRKKRNPYRVGSLEWIAWENALHQEEVEKKRKEDNHAVLRNYKLTTGIPKPS